MPLVYEELRRLAHRHLRGERPDHTLRSTELVQEAYLRLIDQQSSEVENRAHFFAVAARLMRQILVDYARKRRAAKRGYGCKITLDQAVEMVQKRDLDVLALDDVLNNWLASIRNKRELSSCAFSAGSRLKKHPRS